MVSIVYCTKNSKPEHTEHLIKSSGLHKKVEVIEIINNGESLTTSYNRGLEQAKNDYVVFCHDDISVETKQWGKKLLRHFDNTEYGIIGVAGTKYMSDSGKWWEKPKSMYGKVKHTHQGRSWLSEYSPSLENNIEEVVTVDGLFFAVNKKRLNKNFDESVEGFHFYDVDFCFRNHIEGVKIGVITNIRVNHFSVGQTNEQWEENRKIFVEKYKTKLPIKIDETFEKRKLKILIGCLNFEGLTGSEISTLETAKGLSKLNCDVHVISTRVGKHFEQICKKHGIKTYTIDEPAGFKRGDGKWGFNTPKGYVVSDPKKLYPIKNMNWDIIHVNHTPITKQLLQLYPHSNFVNIVRSEVIDLENPIVDPRIKRYIAIRPSIKDYIVNEFDISEDLVDVVYNPFDKDRFYVKDVDSGTNKKVTLFVGTMDYLRKESIQDLSNKVSKEGGELWLVGKDVMGFASHMANNLEHVKYFPPTDNIEEFFHKCDVTAGIMLGRTTIEGFLCGKPAIIYNVDKNGKILSDEFMEVPNDLSIFDYDVIIKQLKDIYIKSFNL